ncbi:hypothetical protein UlMin_039410 [Ulmus minor]
MASYGQRNNLRIKFTSVTPSFFKIIQEDTLQDKKIMIPKKFKRKYGDTLSNPVLLKLPCGLEWKVELSDDKVCFDKGWKEFADYYSLQVGHMLVFRYDLKSRFHVFIFDKSTSEIDYPTNSIRFRKPNIKEKIPDEDFVEILDDLSHCPKSREKSLLLCSWPQKRMKTDTIEKAQNNLYCARCKETKVGNSMNDGKLLSLGSEMKVKLEFSAEEGGVKSTTSSWRNPGSSRRMTAQEKAIALKKASGFSSENPFFAVVLQRSSVGYKYILNLPTDFSRRYLSNNNDDVILKVSDGRTWSIKFSFKMYGERTTIARLLYGWKTFVQDNDLQVGDVCVFVLTRSSKTSFEVVIFRDNGIENLPVPPVVSTEGGALKQEVNMRQRNRPSTANSKAKALERAKNFQSENPFFTMKLGRSHRIPSKFARKYIMKSKGDGTLSVSDVKSWPVQYKVRGMLDSSQASEIFRGWPSFSRDNSLSVGDICTFELTNADEISFKVHINRIAVDAQDCLFLDSKIYLTSSNNNSKKKKKVIISSY